MHCLLGSRSSVLDSRSEGPVDARYCFVIWLGTLRWMAKAAGTSETEVYFERAFLALPSPGSSFVYKQKLIQNLNNN